MNDEASFISDIDIYLYILENIRILTLEVKLSQFMDPHVQEYLPALFVKKLDTNTLPIYA